jgi:hypothetical protein
MENTHLRLTPMHHSCDFYTTERRDVGRSVVSALESKSDLTVETVKPPGEQRHIHQLEGAERR